MSAPFVERRLTRGGMEAVLAVTAKLATPFDLRTMLVEVVAAAREVLACEAGSVWLYDAAADELVLEVATGIAPVRVPAGSGIVGSCARGREAINVPDCYADPRFNREVDRRTGFRTRCMLTLPLVGHRDELVGVMQLLNKHDGVFGAHDEYLAGALAAQCAVALQRARMTEDLLEGERMRQELLLAREMQMATLPAAMPVVPGYDLHGISRPADETGGDSFDLALLPQGLLVVLADATGHGIGPALSVTQMQGMLRMAFRLGAGLDEAYLHLNNQLDEDLPADRFITAFIGLLDPASHLLAYHSGGQGPILHWSATSDSFAAHRPTCFPLAAMPLASRRPGREITLAEGDLLALISDGLFDCRNASGEEFGQARVEALLAASLHLSMAELADRVLEGFDAFRAGAPQEDDVTLVLIRRLPTMRLAGSFPRRIDALPAIFAFTADSVGRLGAAPALLPTIDFAVEELFTNMVKYSRESAADVRITLAARGGDVEVELIDSDVDAFDPRSRPEVDIHQPLEARQPGGLGIHLVRRMVEDFVYRYVPELRQSTLRFRVAARPQMHCEGGQGNAVD